MYIQKIKKNNKKYYYLSKSIRDKNSNRTKTIVIESLGSKEELINKYGNNFEKWLKDYALKCTENEKSLKFEANISQVPLTKNKIEIKNIGYLFIDKVCKRIGLDKICKHLQDAENLDFNLYKIVLAIISRDIFDDTVSSNLFNFTKDLYNYSELNENDVTQTLKVICKHNVYIQKNLYKNVSKDNTKDNCLLYDCSNYGNVTSSMKKNNKRFSNAVTLGKIFLDSNLLPCGFVLENDMLDLDSDNIEIIKHLKYKFKDASFFALPGCLESKTDRTIYRRFPNNNKLSFSLAKNFPKDTVKNLMNPKDWKRIGSQDVFDLRKLAQELNSNVITSENFCEIFSGVYYKNINIDNNNLFIVFNFEMQHWMREIRDYQLKKFQQTVEDKLAFVSKNIGDKQQNFLVSEIKDNETKIHFFDDTSFRKDEDLDGYCLMCEELDVESLKLVAMGLSKKYNELDYFFDTYKPESCNNDKLTLKESLLSHFLTSYISFFVVRNLESFLNEKYWGVDIVYQLRNMKVFKLAENIWTPTYNLTNLIEELSNMFDLNVNFNLISDSMLN